MSNQQLIDVFCNNYRPDSYYNSGWSPNIDKGRMLYKLKQLGAMKRGLSLGLKIIAGLFVLVLVFAIAVPLLFKDRIREKVEKEINASLNAKVTFGDYSLGLFRHFPDLTFSLSDLLVTGKEVFDNDTLASIGKTRLVFDLASIFGKDGYVINSVVIEDGLLNAIVLEDGSANWDIMADTSVESGSEDTGSAEMKVNLRNFEIVRGTIAYRDHEADMHVFLSDMEFNLSGDMSLSQTNLRMTLASGMITYLMEGTKYLDKTKIRADLDLSADMDKYIFTLQNGFFSLNDLGINVSGQVIMPGDDIETRLEFSSQNSSFKSLLSLVPSVYMNDYSDLLAEGSFSLNGSANGIYSETDSTYPDIRLDISVKDGLISYPALPEKITNISLESDIFFDGRSTDNSVVTIDPFQMELAGNRFRMNFGLKTPVSDPDFRLGLDGTIDLAAILKAMPVDSIDLSGLLRMSVRLAGKMSQVENEKHDNFEASGKLNISEMAVAASGYPAVNIAAAEFTFTPAFAALSASGIRIGSKSDFAVDGRLEDYIQYFFSDGTLKGELKLRSKLTDATELLAGFAGETSEAEDTAALQTINIPRNLDFRFNAEVDRFVYDRIDATGIKGEILIRDGILSLRDSEMNMLGGRMMLNALYDTRDTLKPSMRAALSVNNIGVGEAFNAFNTVRLLAPAAKGIDGRISASLDYQSLLGKDFMPVANTISGSGSFNSEQLTLVDSKTFSLVKQTLKLGDKYTNTFRNVSASFRIADGRIIVNPFDVRTGNLKMNISGDHGIDQTLNYFVKTEIPRSDLGGDVNSLIDNIASQASALGFAFKPSEVLKVNLKVTGTFGKPVMAPVFGSSSQQSGASQAAAAGMIQQALDKTLDQSKAKAISEAETQAAQLLNEAEEKGAMLRAEAEKAAQKIRDEANVQAEKLIADASKKSTLAQLGAKKGAETLRSTAEKNASKIVREADEQSQKLIEEARRQGDEILRKAKNL
jgi:vacuolar-type H+-ATPase subunit H